MNMKKFLAIICVMMATISTISFATHGNNSNKKFFEYYEVPEEEKITSIYLEGMKERVDYVGIKSKLGYMIQYDEKEFQLIKKHEKDYYKANVNIDGLEDSVYFWIEYVSNSYEDLKTAYQDKILEEYEINGNKAFKVGFNKEIYSNENSEDLWKRSVKYHTYIEASNGTYIIEENYFFEASEGWGTRIAQLISKSFKIYDDSSDKITRRMDTTEIEELVMNASNSENDKIFMEDNNISLEIEEVFEEDTNQTSNSQNPTDNESENIETSNVSRNYILRIIFIVILIVLLIVIILKIKR